MAAGGDIFRGKNPGLNVLAEEIFVGVSGHRSVRRQISTLGANHDLLALETSCCKLLDRGAEASLAALKSVIDGSVENVDAVFHCGDRRGRIPFIGPGVWLAEVCADSHGREHEAMRFSKMAGGGAACELLRVARCSFFGGGFGHDAHSGDGAGPGAGLASASAVFGARSRAHARSILR